VPLILETLGGAAGPNDVRITVSALNTPPGKEETLMKARVRFFRGLAGVMVLIFAAGGVARPETKTVKGTLSGTNIAVPLDLDSDSCFAAANGATICTDSSAYVNEAGKSSDSCIFTTQGVTEVELVAGTGCNIGGTIVTGFASCTLSGSSEQGCATHSVGSQLVYQDSSSGDLLFTKGGSGEGCIDLSSAPPFNIIGSGTETITGGTGKNAGATGTLTIDNHGQQLLLDPAIHGFGWQEETFTGTISRP
jgi:hypothetical protein